MINSTKKQIINSILAEINEKLIGNTIVSRGFLNGGGGISLFLFNYYKIKKDTRSYNKAFELLNNESELFSTNYLNKSYSNSLQWLIWLIFNLNSNKIISINKNEYNYVLPIFLANYKDFKKHGNYDLFYGQVGLGLILREFIKKDKFITLNEQFFLDTAEKDGKSFKWFFSLFESENQGYNFGLAHGIPSITLYLSNLFESTCYSNVNLAKLITGSTEFLIANKQDPNKIGSFYPNILTKEKKEDFSRLAWCYGDLGVGYSIWKSGIVTNNNKFIREGLEVLLHCAKRREVNDTRIVDLGICHGSSGLILFYKRLYQLTQLNEFKDACLYWLSFTTDRILEARSIDNILVWDTNKKQHEFKDGLLTGVAGIGMVLSEFISKKNCKNWSEFLLL